MPNDFININALCSELNEKLNGGHIEKVTQPEDDEVHLYVRNGSGNFVLVISASPSYPRIHLTTTKKKNPLTALSFCMFLRRFVQGGKINNIQTLNCDRIADISVTKKNEMFDDITVHIVCELMGRYSNIIVCDENYIIMLPLKIIPFEPSTDRIIAPKAKYEFLKQNKILPADKEKIERLLEKTEFKRTVNGDIDESSVNLLSANIAGFSKKTFEILLEKYRKEKSKTAESLARLISSFVNLNGSKYFSPCTLGNEKEIKDFSAVAPENENCILRESLNACADIYYYELDKKERLKSRAKNLERNLKNRKARLIKKISLLKTKSEESKCAEEYKLKGELLLNNIYKLKKGEKEVILDNYYDGSKLKIKLDETLYPKQNIEKYFKTYNKLKTAGIMTSTQLKEAEEELEYVEALFKNLEIAENDEDINDMEKEVGIYKNDKKQGSKCVKNPKNESKPLKYSVNGKILLIGKNNFQNENITFKIATAEDIWLHIKNSHGAHAVLEKGSSKKDILTAAEITAYYSTSQNAKTEIDYTLKKYVKRHPSKKSGLVIYTDYKTLTVVPNKHEELIVK